MKISLIMACLLVAEGEPANVGPQALACQMDQRLTERLAADGVPAAERAEDAEFLRRLSLDLIGRIPTIAEVRNFLEDTAADKRSLLIERLSADGQHPRHFARTWRALLLPEAETEPQIRYFQPGFEAWLELRRQENAGFDAIVRELLTVPISQPDAGPQFVLRDLRKPNPIAFIAAKNAEPAKIASSSVRLFLGLRLECAQCHDHPFDHWTRNQFWNQAAFFAGIERRGNGAFAPLVESLDRKSIPLMESTETVPALFLDLSVPQVAERQSARGAFAEWMTSPNNPYFAQAIVNRVWGQLMGQGLVDPVDDFRDTLAPSHPELLKELAEAFKTSGFDMSYLVRAICLTDAYQRTSRQTHDGQALPERFARMAVKPLSGEQFYDSLMQTIADDQSEEQDPDEEEQNSRRRQVLEIFASNGQTGDPETSVAQALTLMNGRLVQDAVAPTTSARLKWTLEQFPDSPELQLESLYLAALSRFPTAEEKLTLGEYCSQGETSEHPRRLGDVFWILLNSAEFRWNH